MKKTEFYDFPFCSILICMFKFNEVLMRLSSCVCNKLFYPSLMMSSADAVMAVGWRGDGGGLGGTGGALAVLAHGTDRYRTWLGVCLPRPTGADPGLRGALAPVG